MKLKGISWLLAILLVAPSFSIPVNANEQSSDEIVLVDFDESGSTYVVEGFGGATATIKEDHADASNHVVEVVKGEGAATWAGTTFGNTANNTISPIPFSESDTNMSVRVFSPDKGIEVRLKVEEKGDPTHSVETSAVTTKSNEWETLVFDFANQSKGTEALNLNYTFNMASIFFDFGKEGTGKTYSFDDLTFLGQVSTPPDGEPSAEQDWELVWNDEFEGTELDKSKWKYGIGNGFYSGDEWVYGWGNNESQYYAEDNVKLEDGKLIIEAREEAASDEHGSYDHTSGKIVTEYLFSQAYGKFEARMKLPEGQGYWPAFWMMPQDDVYGGWAASGEIDIMENRGSETNKVGAAIHYGDLWPKNSYSAGEYEFPEGQSTTDFNVYSVEWEPGEIRWYVNDELYTTQTEWYTANGEYPAPFDQEFYMILNLAVGGWYGGEPDETTGFPGQMEVDYVRVYEDQAADYPEPGEPTNPGDGEEQGDGADPVDESKDWKEVGDSLIVDGTFEATSEFGDEKTSKVWNVFNLGDYETWAGLADFSIENEELKAEVQKVGWDWWHIQLMQDVTVPSGIYKVEFDMRSERDRDVSVELVGSESGIKEFDVGSTMETYETYIKVGSDGDYSLMFGLGRGENDPELAVPYDVFIDNVRLVEVVEDTESEEVEFKRISGDNRYETSRAFSEQHPSNSLDTVILASGLDFPDALAGGVLNNKLNGNVLLVNDSESVIKQQLKEAKRVLKEEGKVVILGEKAAVSKKVEDAFAKAFPVERLGGDTRYQTALKIADKVNDNPDEVIVAYGLDFADALSIVPYATEKEIPIVLNTKGNHLQEDVAKYMTQNKNTLKKVTIIGGTEVVPTAVEKELKKLGIKTIERISGETRYMTSLEIAKKLYPETDAIALSNAYSFADALSGSRFAFDHHLPVLLTDKDEVKEEVISHLKGKVKSVYLYGGESVISESLKEQFKK
ncbi:cell wall-binding repeat-containing protein [Guptibacillus hwajinpoensis]|uniref:Beta-glucanase (GH16 family)/putative cell wall-binding protein n=1 Tax=Guptibacillus hwajinpoensis TaxID=208199 RepID=A0ABU0K1C2_9BACL|nr:cell wall-binding repeat-containing protein [Alkalihalobacillus hemicentroti]MDQ0482500.1 beta-glucanase (GH16 family)/putative cell wall-binding protein [Alkalihalobacillus hemicentroti]